MNTQFTPSPLAPFQFQAILDANPFNVTVFWNTFGQRWYIRITDQSGTTIVTKPLVGSPASYAISMTAGYFVSTLTYSDDTQIFTVIP